jgi:3-oxoacyl-[acyl-carrier protein] reductase
MDFLNLTGRVVIVTGGAQGIGLAIARRLAGAGASVAIADVNFAGAREAARSLSELGASGAAFACDVSDPQSVTGMVDAVLRKFGKIDILVNNAGIGGHQVPIQEQTDDEWHRVIAIDLTGVFYCCRAVIPHMIGRSYGRIVTISSIAGKEGSPNLLPYSSAKAGVIGLTKALAKEVARYNILVNAVTPGLTETPLLNEIPVERQKALLSRTPISRFARPNEIAAMVHWLASEDVSFTTGSVFDISGGRATY